jgi:hypothetical protein
LNTIADYRTCVRLLGDGISGNLLAKVCDQSQDFGYTHNRDFHLFSPSLALIEFSLSNRCEMVRVLYPQKQTWIVFFLSFFFFQKFHHDPNNRKPKEKKKKKKKKQGVIIIRKNKNFSFCGGFFFTLFFAGFKNQFFVKRHKKNQ